MAFGIDHLRADMHRRFDSVDQRLTALEGKVTAMAGTVADLDAALTAYETAEQAAITEINAAVQAIQAKVGPGVDLTNEITRITNVQQSLQAAADAVQQAANPTPPPAGRKP